MFGPVTRATLPGLTGRYPGFALAGRRSVGAFPVARANRTRTSMAASQAHITGSTPMGANLIADGATFRVWALGALHVHVELGGPAGFQPMAANELLQDPATGHWTGFFPGVVDGTKYRFFVVGPGGS